MTPEAATRPSPPAGIRWAVLFLISLAMFGNYYLYDTIAPVADLMKSQLGFTDERIGLLYSSYSLGAVLILLPGGIFIDRYGTRKATMLFGTICAVAGFLTMVSDDFYVMLAGRFLLSAAEPLIVAITAAIAKWFRGKQLAFAMGVNLFIARLGQIAADWSPTWMPGAYQSGWRDPLVIGAFLGLTCVAGAVAYWILEKRAEASYFLGEAGGTDKLVLGDIFKFNRSFWFITALCVSFYTIVFPFRTFAIKYFIEAHGAERGFAGQLNSVLPFAAMFATPLIGLLVDKIGRRATLMAVGSVILLPVFPLLAYTDVTLYLPVVMLGIAFSLIPAIMWPAVAYIVEQGRLGSAYALMFLLQQVAIFLMDWGVGRANDFAGAGADNPAGYVPMMWMFTALGILAVLYAVMLWRNETGPRGHGLETIKA